MDQRSKNRIREHKDQPEHFLALVKDVKTTEVRPGQSLWHCKCGWLGWLDDEAKEEILNNIPVARRVRLPSGEMSKDYWAFDDGVGERSAYGI